MSVELFIGILVVSATATSIGIEIIKKLFDAFKWKYNSRIIAFVTAFIVGMAEVAIYAIKGNMPGNVLTIFYAICMGIVNAIGTAVGYDTVKAFIIALFSKVE